MSVTGPSGPAPVTSDAREPKGAGIWVGYLIFVLFLLFLIVFDAQAAYQSEWASFSGTTAFILVYLLLPTGGVKWLRRRLRGGKRPLASK